MRAETLKGHLDFLLLATLAEEPAHGYRIIEELKRRSATAFDLPEGTVYPALHRLEQGGLLAGSWASGSGRKRRRNGLTAVGRRGLADGGGEWHGYSRA